jgi:Uma2 family endonuclease
MSTPTVPAGARSASPAPSAPPVPVAPAAPAAVSVPIILPLEPGDHLTRQEFERRYEAMPDLKKAELIEGVVYMPSPVSTIRHGSPHVRLGGWLLAYEMGTPGVLVSDNGSLRLDNDNEPQPDNSLIILPERGGQAQLDGAGYIVGAPELVAEVSASSVSIDLHTKLNLYRRHSVREYIVWRVLDSAVDWFVLHEGSFDPLPLTNGIYQSQIFPGLWLDPAALVAGDLHIVFQVAQQGIASPEHAAFVAQLAAPTP